MVSNFDSTPARKAPHLEAFCVAEGGDAMAYSNEAFVNFALIDGHDPYFDTNQAVTITRELLHDAMIRSS